MTEPEPTMMVRCQCGEVYTLHMHTVCPRCCRWPKARMVEVLEMACASLPHRMR
jgi:hypothetical protein